MQLAIHQLATRQFQQPVFRPEKRRRVTFRVVSDYTVAFHHATAHGLLAAVHIPDSPEPVPPGVLALLHPDEAQHALTLRGYRQSQFVGGRIALRRACEHFNIRPGPILSNDRGAPTVPSALSGSISHKGTLAIALAARAEQGTVGVDLEEYLPTRLSILPSILTPTEQKELEGLPTQRKWVAALMRFSLKESIYKAIDPFVRRYVGFHEVEVRPDLQGNAAVHFQLKHNEGPFNVQAQYHWLHGRLVTTVRVSKGPSSHK